MTGVDFGLASGRELSPGISPNLREHTGASTAQKRRAKMVVWKSFICSF